MFKRRQHYWKILPLVTAVGLMLALVLHADVPRGWHLGGAVDACGQSNAIAGLRQHAETADQRDDRIEPLLCGVGSSEGCHGHCVWDSVVWTWPGLGERREA
jgi:hypothetical protein